MLNTKINLKYNTDITLNKHGLWSMEGDRRSDVISCNKGTIWITQEGDMRDYILEPGQDFWVTRPGTVIVQSLENAQFKYSLNEIQSHIEPNAQPVHYPVRSRLGQRSR
jgi:Protein of unknown function (DUF2917)